MLRNFKELISLTDTNIDVNNQCATISGSKNNLTVSIYYTPLIKSHVVKISDTIQKYSLLSDGHINIYKIILTIKLQFYIF